MIALLVVLLVALLIATLFVRAVRPEALKFEVLKSHLPSVAGVGLLAGLFGLAPMSWAQTAAAPSAGTAPRAVAVPSAPAQEQGPRWGNLSAVQRESLAPLQKDWVGIDASRKQKWLEVAARMQSMTAEERERVRERMAEWARLSPAERGRARLNFQEVRSLPAEGRQALWEAYQALPEDERKALLEQAKAAARPAPTVPGQTKAPEPKRNTVPEPVSAAQLAKAVAPTVVQARPGATTTLVSRGSSPPPHQQPGLTKIVASEDLVDPVTLLPRRGAAAPSVAAAPDGGNTPRQP